MHICKLKGVLRTKTREKSVSSQDFARQLLHKSSKNVKFANEKRLKSPFYIIKKVLESKLEVASYGVVSVGSVQNEKKKQPVSVGVFGHVFVGDVDKKLLDKAMK